MNKQQLVALGISALVVIWMVFPRSSNTLETEGETATGPSIRALSEPESVGDAGTFTVLAARLTSSEYTEFVRVRGRTEALRRVDVRAEQPGRVIATPVTEGSRVAAGDVLCEIAVDTRESDLLEAESRQQQTRVEYDATENLFRQNLASEVAVAQSRAAYDAATAAVARARLALDNTRVRAPFDGIVETRRAEVGDLLERGTVCATLIDDDPMLLVGLVPEQQIGKLTLGASVNAQLLTGEQVAATVSYLARSADPASRSYRIEAMVEDGTKLRDGITTELMILADRTRAHLIPPSALTLDDSGIVGVKTLDSNNRVDFTPVTVVGDEASQIDAGVWVTGLPEQVVLITHGQEIVFPGQQVEADFSWSQSSR